MVVRHTIGLVSAFIVMHSLPCTPSPPTAIFSGCIQPLPSAGHTCPILGPSDHSTRAGIGGRKLLACYLLFVLAWTVMQTFILVALYRIEVRCSRMNSTARIFSPYCTESSSLLLTFIHLASTTSKLAQNPTLLQCLSSALPPDPPVLWAKRISLDPEHVAHKQRE